MLTLKCPVCGACDWQSEQVVWDDLARQWRLSPIERDYVDQQQGTTCGRCGCALRVCALALALTRHYRWRHRFAWMPVARPRLRILEVNEAGQLTRFLGRFPARTLSRFPEVDLQALPFDDSTFDLVVHSDTLEHVSDPLRALEECRRVLRPGGALAYTVPVIHGRSSRRRGSEEEPSFHGTRDGREYPVVTEYGSDMWVQPLSAGFTRVDIHTFGWPAATAMVCS